jgi:hypothetical protein
VALAPPSLPSIIDPFKIVRIASVNNSYILGKMIWEGLHITRISKEDGGFYKFEGPYRDPGERTAVLASALGIPFSQLFDQKWFDTYCGGKR